MLGGMQKHHSNALTGLRVTLAREMVPDELLEHLLENKILTSVMKEKIESKQETFRRNVALLDVLPRRGPNAFSFFCAALNNTEQQHLAKLLEDRADNAPAREAPIPLSVQESQPREGRRCQESEMSLDSGDGPGSVAYTTVDFYLSHCEQAYKMISRPRGIALIISNIHFFSPELDYRKGGQVDLVALKTLCYNLNYHLMVRTNVTAQGILSELKNFSQLPEHSKMDSAIVAVLSHGVDGAVYGSDGKLVQLQKVFTQLDNAHCPQLQNKPKMFFIQACRGEEADRGVDQRDGREQATSPGFEQSDAGKEERKIRLPSKSDMICAYACLKDTISLRNTKLGSWFIQDLTEVFSKHAKDTHVADMLVRVNACIKRREGNAPGTEFDRCKEMSEYSSTLCRDLYLFPGIKP